MKWIDINNKPTKHNYTFALFFINHNIVSKKVDTDYCRQDLLSNIVDGFFNRKDDYFYLFICPPDGISIEIINSAVTHYSTEYCLPKVKKYRSLSVNKKLKVLKRDRYTCKNCGESPAINPNIELEIDHINPFSLGGTDNIENLQVLCKSCNRIKSGKNNILNK